MGCRQTPTPPLFPSSSPASVFVPWFTPSTPGTFQPRRTPTHNLPLSGKSNPGPTKISSTTHPESGVGVSWDTVCPTGRSVGLLFVCGGVETKGLPGPRCASSTHDCGGGPGASKPCEDPTNKNFRRRNSDFYWESSRTDKKETGPLSLPPLRGPNPTKVGSDGKKVA